MGHLHVAARKRFILGLVFRAQFVLYAIVHDGGSVNIGHTLYVYPPHLGQCSLDDCGRRIPSALPRLEIGLFLGEAHLQGANLGGKSDDLLVLGRFGLALPVGYHILGHLDHLLGDHILVRYFLHDPLLLEAVDKSFEPLDGSGQGTTKELRDEATGFVRSQAGP